ncbi:hypothetical protein LEP1GSC016_0219 [Leptospira borgpetersenii serovar Hardjo-bovis str. Sponselee]|uniref:Uncharacterized protein n=1 Tax=Leptospira borgpetersenii serovar Hardjo-bovis str. Sponselee TaxID=1303729 RepID=M6C486_LEPBO|nr:hypothetical protein LEP1GSC016_0219 [Leptospira borgpetersenii serovar Hardjo-bovis str. Sponselee]
MSVQFRIVVFFGKELLQDSTRIVIEVAPYVFFFFFSIPVLIWADPTESRPLTENTNITT